MRASGILLPVSSLPSPHGIGSLGSEAYRFVDFLRDSGQTYWQILPLGPTGYGDSPYQSFSAFAANPYLIDLDLLADGGLLTRDEIERVPWGVDESQVDYQCLFEHRLPLLRRAVLRMDPGEPEFARFCRANADWLDDYALFMALKEENNLRPFTDWDDALRLRVPAALEQAKERLNKDLFFWRAVQYLFYTQWERLKRYANERGVKIIGDIPIYVSPDSSDIWASPRLFQTDGDGRLSEVAGVPPDGFSADGQLWGNPLYDWDAHRASGYAWWVRRLKHASTIYDVVRIDHFRGFESYFAIPAGDKTAANGRWRKGPGIEFVRAVKEALPGIEIIAEDLGYLTEDVKRLLAESGFPGMKVLQFAFDSREASDYLPHNYVRHSVVYTGTHDNTTTEDWQHTAPPEDVAFARSYLDVTPMNSFTYSLIRAALGSVCDTCVIPLQDYLCLGAEARINTPSTVGGNWRWRLRRDALSDSLARGIRALAKLYGRLPPC